MHTQPSPRSALVTGGSSGIGLAIARHLQQQGYRVALVARDRRRLEAVSAELGGVAWMAADLARRDDVEAVAAWIGETFDTLDVLVNNAGFTRLVAATHAPGGSRAGVGCIAGRQPEERLSHVAGVVATLCRGGWTDHPHRLDRRPGRQRQSRRAGLRGSQGRPARLRPGAGTRTRTARNHGEQRGAGLHRRYRFFPGGLDPQRVAAIVGETPLGRTGRVEDIAAAVAWLASPEAGFVTGTVVSVNGGWRVGN
ncbi:putative short-chain dehydrogenase [Pseudomonas aeruginosa]|nr:putative short-chain dehydrogenase [Pseudomonas aeruginosa]